MRPSVLVLSALLALPFTAHIAHADGTWSLVPPPEPRYGHTAVYDAARQRMLVFGGGTAGGSGPAPYSNQVWALSLTGTKQWTQVVPAGAAPDARYQHSMVLDPIRDQLVIFGGFEPAGFLNDVWTLSLSGTPTWTHVIPGGTPPSARGGQVAVYDPVGDRMVMFGGQVSGGALLNDIWALSLAGAPAWTPLAASGVPPSGRRGAAAVYDAGGARMLLFGGLGAGFLNDVWALSFSGGPAWSSVTALGTPPSPRAFHAAAYDAARSEIVVMGGLGGAYQNDVWTLSLAGGATWSQLTPTGSPPSARGFHSAVLDPVHDRIEVFSGFSGVAVNDLWELTRAGGPAWQRSPASGELPPPRRSESLIFDPLRQRMIMFGGGPGDSGLNDVWALSLADNQGWQQISPDGAPSARQGHTAIYDPVRDRMLVFGGRATTTLLNDVWALSLSGVPAWTQLEPLGTPPGPRWLHTAIYDPDNDRMVVFGGIASSSDVWVLSLAGTPTWSKLETIGQPAPARYGHSAIYDPGRRRMVIFGGDSVNDTWSLVLLGTAAWSQLLPASPPGPRYGHAAIYDATGDRMVVFGGKGPGVDYSNEVWSLPMASPTAWSNLTPAGALPLGRMFTAAIFDPDRNRMVAFGGYNFDGSQHYLNDLWSLQWTGSLGVKPSASLRLRLAPAYPNPARGVIAFQFALPVDAATELRVYDVSGREVRKLVDGVLPAGEHVVRWDRRSASGARVEPGLYFCELTALGERLSGRITVGH
jgi:hypothetical protein